MSENVLRTLQTAIQDVIAPDVRELKVRMGALEKQIDTQGKQNETQFESIRELVRSVLLQQEAMQKASSPQLARRRLHTTSTPSS